MPTKGTYYINAPSFNSATAVFTDTDLSICAPDGYYSFGGIVRQQVGCNLLPATACPSCEFISLWDTTLVSTGSSNNRQVKLPLVNTGSYNFTVNWGDGRSDLITSWNQAETLHTYDTAGSYTITITGVIVGWSFNLTGDKLKLVEIFQWGCFNSGNAINAFAGCENLELDNVVDTLDLTGVTTLRGFFWLCTNLTTINRVSEWDVSGVINFFSMFLDCINFNDNVNDWDVSNATTYTGLNKPEGLHGVFKNCALFNQPLNNWDLTNVRTINAILEGAVSFNQDISMWDVGNVRDFQSVFFGATSFNQDISAWNTSNALTMTSMFRSATSFNQNVDGWDVGSVTDFSFMFFTATAFDFPLGNWDMSSANNLVAFMNGKTDLNYSPANFDATLIGWSTQTLQTGVTADFGGIKYTVAGQAARNTIIAAYAWDINSGGLI